MKDRSHKKYSDNKKYQKQNLDEDTFFKKKATKQFKQKKRDLDDEDVMEELERYK